MRFFILSLWSVTLLSPQTSIAWVFNNPYPEREATQSIYYSSFSEQPKTLDPARSYSANEYLFINQILEPLLDYDYFKRPYQVVPQLAAAVPEVTYLDAAGHTIQKLGDTAPAYSVYRIRIKPGILYQPHPAFAKKANGEYRYHHLAPRYLDEHSINQLSGFKQTGTREVTVDDFIYQIKRLANPAVGSPIYSLMSDHILGFKAFATHLPHSKAERGHYLDLRAYPFKGVRKIDNTTFEIILKGQYTQFLFWLAMPFFAPTPWEVDAFYAQVGMEENNITFDWYPVGTGPFMLVENNPNRNMTMQKNPNYHADFFPTNYTSEDMKAGFVTHPHARLPLVDKAVFTLEKETIPRWNKFLQGYYDLSEISADSFDQAIRINRLGEPEVSDAMKAQHIELIQTMDPHIYYLGFNMLDPIVGGKSERSRLLRQAISIAVDHDEYISIFYNGRGIAAQGPLAPGILGYKEGKEGINPYVYEWQDNKIKRRSIADAKALLKQAGYPNGIDPKTHKALILHYDVTTSGNSEDKSLLDWMRKQFSAIGIDLNIRTTLYNRFQEKMRTGDVQLFSWGWNADYPDPENFLFLLYGPNGKVKFGGENAANYSNPEFDRLFDLMKNRPNDALRQQYIAQLLEIARHDAPWSWGIHPVTFTLSQSWVSKVKPNTISTATLKYMSVDVPLRNQLRTEWNQPILWPLGVFLLLVVLLVIPLIYAYVRKERATAPRM